MTLTAPSVSLCLFLCVSLCLGFYVLVSPSPSLLLSVPVFICPPRLSLCLCLPLSCSLEGLLSHSLSQHGGSGEPLCSQGT